MSKKRWIIQYNSLFSKGEKGDIGPAGPAGAGAVLPISSNDVKYNSSTLTEVLDDLLYIDLIINSFTAAPSTYEKGQVLTSASFTWVLNKTIQSQTVTGTNVVAPTLLVGDRTKIITLSNISTDTIVTLTVDDVTTDGNPVKTETVTLTFLNKLYWGKSILTTVNNAFVLALSNSELKSSKAKSFNIDASTNEYIWFALPTAYGIPSFLTNGFNGGFILHSTLSLINASGYTEEYEIYRTVNHSLGLTFVDVE